MLSQLFILRINATSTFIALFSSFQKSRHNEAMHVYVLFLSKKSYHLALLRSESLFEIMN
jgi:hypothetical protein